MSKQNKRSQPSTPASWSDPRNLIMHPFVRTAITALLMIVPAAAIASSDIAMHRDPGCGCCEKWAAQVRQQFHRKVQIIDDADRGVLQRRVGVSTDL
ncbi:hypothetical protein ACNJD8_21390, partial [Mycobacterium tuberculosis]